MKGMPVSDNRCVGGSVMINRNVLNPAAFLLLAVHFLAVNAEASVFGKDSTLDEQRAEIREMRDATLARLYKAQPAAQGHVQKAAGYAVFSNFGLKILVAGGGNGSGIVVDNKTGKETFMKMAEVQAGLGFGIKKFSLVWVFEKKSDLDQFISSGWDLGGQSTVSAKVGGAGAEVYAGALSVFPGVWLYQLTGDGLALELTAKGTKYYKDDRLN
jgi:lipid-binding SYLF domain-containing protein